MESKRKAGVALQVLGLGRMTSAGAGDSVGSGPQAAVLASSECPIVTWGLGMSTVSGGKALEEGFFYLWFFFFPSLGLGATSLEMPALSSELMDSALACLDWPHCLAHCGRGPVCPGFSGLQLAQEEAPLLCAP